MNGRGKPYLLGGLVAVLLGVACWFSFGGDRTPSSGPPSDRVAKEEPDKAPTETKMEKERKPRRSQDKRQVVPKTAKPRRPTQIIKKNPKRSKEKRPRRKLEPFG